MVRHHHSLLLSLLLALFVVGCERPIIDGTEEPQPGQTVDGKRRVRLSVSSVEQTAFDNAAGAKAREGRRTPKAVGEVCTRLSLGLFDADGEKVQNVVNQTVGDKDFGIFDVALAEGVYTIVLFGHSGESAVSMPSLQKVTANYKVTDSFLYCGDLTIDGSSVAYSYELKRCVAKVHLVFAYPLGDDVAQVKFSYRGGSSTIDPTTGYGCVDSKQTETRAVGNHSAPEFDIYTYPHEESDVLTTLQVDALDKDGKSLRQKTLTDIPVRLNHVTLVEGDFFGENPDDGRGKVIVTVDDSWAGEIVYRF